MTVNINIHVTHRRHTNDLETVQAEGTTVKEVLSNLVSRYPGMEPELFHEKTGDLRGHIEIYINGKTAYPGELEKPVLKGDDINILTFLAGG